MESCHVSVLPNQVIHYLKPERGGNYLDCTFGGGGHSRLILNYPCKLTAIDRDPDALKRAKSLDFYGKMTLLQANFADAAEVLAGNQYDGILADLGTSMDQLKGDRGFSFQGNQDLDMRMNPEDPESAADVVNSRTEQELIRIFKRGGMGSESFGIAKSIIRQRPIIGTEQLVKIASEHQSPKERMKNRNPATLLFQVLRIEVNQEINSLQTFLKSVPLLAKPKCRLVIISFHSLEDQIVTKTFRDWAAGDTAPANWRGAERREKKGVLLTRKAVTADLEELEKNPSSRSALLRAFEFSGE